MIKSVGRFFNNISYNMLANFSLRLGNYVLVILIARMLDVSSSGIYTVANNYLSIGLLISYWGFSNQLTLEVSRSPQSFGKYFSNLIVLRAGLAVITSLFIFALIRTLDYPETTAKVLLLFLLSILPDSLNQLINAAFLAFEKIKYLSLASILFSLVKIVLGYVFLKSGATIVGIAALLVICEYLSLLVSAFLLRRYLPKFHFSVETSLWKGFVLSSLPFFGMALVTTLDTRTEIIIISKILGEEAVGFFQTANVLLGVLILFPEGIRNASLPLLAKYSIANDGKFERLTIRLSQFVVLLSLPLTILVFFYAADILPLIFTQKYMASIPILQVLIWSFCSYGLNVVASRSLIVLGKEKFLMKAILTSGIVTIGLDLLLAPIYGLTAVAYVRLFTSLVLLCIYGLYLHRLGHPLIELHLMTRLMLVGLGMFAGLALFQRANHWLAVLVGIFIYLSGLLLLKVLTPKEIRQIKELIQAIFSRNKAGTIGDIVE